MLFTTAAHDQNGLQALNILREASYRTLVLRPGQDLPAHAIALFTPLKGEDLQGHRGRYLRTSAVKLDEQFTPAWAAATPFRVAVIRTAKDKAKRYCGFNRKWGFEDAVLQMARQYASWVGEKSTKLVPWTVGANYPLQARCFGQIQDWLHKQEVQEFRQFWIIKRPDSGAVSTFCLGKWDVNYSEARRIFPAAAAEQALGVLRDWEKSFVREATWVQTTQSLPSLVVRLDCIVRDGRLIVYEVEERPAGIGVSSIVSPDFADQFRALAETWPPFRVEVSPLRKATDDSLWMSHMPWDGSGSELVLVRAEPEETQYHNLEPFSVSSLKAKGDKSYGEKMGLWRRIVDVDQLDWSSSFVLKPLQGSKLKEMEIWDPKGRPGSSVKAKVLKTLAGHEAMFCQQLFPPMESGLPGFCWMIFRVFFGFDCRTRQWKCLGGNWNARSNLRIHGASDALFGPAVVE